MGDRDERGRWLPGETGNPGGRPKGFRRMADDLYRVLGEVPTGDELEAAYDGLEIPAGVRAQIDMAGDRQEAFVRLLVNRMMTGNWEAVREIFGRLDPIPSRTELSGPGGGPITSAGVQLAGAAPDDAADVYMRLIRGEPDDGGTSDTDGPTAPAGDAGEDGADS